MVTICVGRKINKKWGETFRIMLEIDKIYCMDCLEGMKQIPDNSIDLVVADPPYNLNKPFKNDNLTEEEYISFLTPILKKLKNIIKPKHSIIIFFDSGQKLPLFWKSILKTKLYFQKSCTLYKPNDCSMPHNRILRKSEVFYILSKTPELHHEGEKYIHDCLIANHTKKEKWYHPTAKNINIIKELILSHSCKHDLVLDPFMGSGATAVACKLLNRHYIGFEINPDYCRIAEQRLKNIPKRLDNWIPQENTTKNGRKRLG